MVIEGACSVEEREEEEEGGDGHHQGLRAAGGHNLGVHVTSGGGCSSLLNGGGLGSVERGQGILLNRDARSRNRVERRGRVARVDSRAKLDVKVLVEVAGVAANLRQLFVEVASVVGVTSSRANGCAGGGWHVSSASRPFDVIGLFLKIASLVCIGLTNNY